MVSTERTTRFVVVNGDDLGASPGVNRGIVEAHQRGVLTSASLMVDMPASLAGARAAAELPGLSVGLHADVTEGSGLPVVNLETGARCADLLERQFERFVELTGRLPTHVDSHHHVHRNPALLPHFLDLADRCGVPMREHSPVHHVSGFYGQWDGVTHLEQVSVDTLIHLLDAEDGERVTELGCHPGYCDPDLRSSYRLEREAELRTLCSPALREQLRRRRIRLASFAEVADLLGDVTPRRATP